MNLCPICQTSGIPCFISGGYRMYRCGKCSTAYVWPMPSSEQLKEFYATFHSSLKEGGYYDEVEERMQLDFPHKISQISSEINGNLKLLDVGCGKGYFIKACQENGIDAVGIDLSKSGVEYAQNNLGVNATLGDLSEMSGWDEKFDVVTLWATIEHLPDPSQILDNIWEVLKPGGYIFLDTGIGYDWLDRRLPGCNQWYDPPQHLFVFSLKGVQSLLKQSNFSTLKIDTHYERSAIRKWIKIMRNAVSAISLDTISKICCLKNDTFEFRRYPLGHLMSISAKKCVKPSGTIYKC